LLLHNSKEFGNLKRKGGILTLNAEGEINRKSYTFKSIGNFNKTLYIYNALDNNKIGEIKIKWYGNNNGQLIFESGEKFSWKCTDFFRGEWAWANIDSEEIMKFKPGNLMNKTGEIMLNTQSNLLCKTILLLTGLHLKLIFNYWIIVLIIIIFALIRG